MTDFNWSSNLVPWWLKYLKASLFKNKSQISYYQLKLPAETIEKIKVGAQRQFRLPIRKYEDDYSFYKGLLLGVSDNITLVVTLVCERRLKSIKPSEAVANGADKTSQRPVFEFARLWNRKFGYTKYRWPKNPMVRVVCFKVINKDMEEVTSTYLTAMHDYDKSPRSGTRLS